ncbi:MAG TPA: septum formation initiator family protein [Pyrinomonadaceae bacterium]|nr:septum formation initiator family protein [Pyrinomonadaceae bacterium]
MAANPFWNDPRLDAQQPAARALSLPSPAAEPFAGATGTRAATRRRDLSLPSWVVFSMIMLATFAVCVTVTMRTRAASAAAEQRFVEMESDVQSIREKNAALRRDVERLHKDPRAREAAARERLNMVRANEIVVPLD